MNGRLPVNSPGFLLAWMAYAIALPSSTRSAENTLGSLEITLEPSRAQATAGSGLQIIGTIKNTSQIPVLICEHTTTITTPGEVSQESVVGLDWARFTVDSDADPKAVADYKDVLVLGPGQSTHAFWNVNRSYLKGVELPPPKSWLEQLGRQIDTELGYMFFPPGDYKFSVQAKFWPATAKRPLTKEELAQTNYDAPGYQNTVSTLTIRMGAPITVVLLGAAIGGLAAFVLKRQLPGARVIMRANSTFLGRVAANISAAIGAALLGCIVTILLSRLAETQFPIRVNVSDLWGAIAIGFFGAYSGVNVLERYLGRVTDDDRSMTNQGAANPNPGGDSQKQAENGEEHGTAKGSETIEELRD